MLTLDRNRLSSADPLFRDEIMQSGILLAGNPDLFALQEVLFRKKMDRLRDMLHEPKLK